MPVAGLVRLRKHQLARQVALGTKVAATRAYPFRGVPTSDLAWTDPDVDAGSIDPTVAPTRGAADVTAPLTIAALDYNSVPAILSGFFGGGVDPTGTTAKTWVFEPSSETPDELDAYTYEFGDDVVTDWFQLGDGIVESFDLTGPDGRDPISASVNWRFGSTSSTGSTDSPVDGTVPTPDLNVDTAATIVYLKDMAIAIASDVAGLTTGQVTDALHSFVMRFSGDIDQKRYANGDQSFDVDAYVRVNRSIELECTFAKTDDTVGTGSEADAWFSDDAVDRYVQLTFTSLVEAEMGVPYSLDIILPMRYYTRVEGEVGGNSTVVLTGHAFFDPVDFEGVFSATVVNTLASTDLGPAGS